MKTWKESLEVTTNLDKLTELQKQHDLQKFHDMQKQVKAIEESGSNAKLVAQDNTHAMMQLQIEHARAAREHQQRLQEGMCT